MCVGMAVESIFVICLAKKERKRRRKRKREREQKLKTETEAVITVAGSKASEEKRKLQGKVSSSEAKKG